TVRPFHVAAWIEDFPGSKPTIKQKLAAVRMLYDFSGRSENHTIESGACSSRAKVCGQERQDARLEPRRRQNAAGFNSKGIGSRLTRPGAHCRDVLQLRPGQRSTETQSRRLLSQWCAPAAETPRKRRQGARDARASPARADIGRVHCGRRPPERAAPVPER